MHVTAQKHIKLLLALLLCAAMLLTLGAAVLADHHCHNCTHKNCAVCAWFHQAEKLLKSAITYAAVPGLMALLALSGLTLFEALPVILTDNPVSMKVKMNN